MNKFRVTKVDYRGATAPEKKYWPIDIRFTNVGKTKSRD